MPLCKTNPMRPTYTEQQMETIARHLGVDELDQDEGIVTCRGKRVSEDDIQEALNHTQEG